MPAVAQPYSVLVQSIEPSAVAVDSSGNIYLGTGTASLIYEYSSSGQKLATFNTGSAASAHVPNTNTTAIDPAALAFFGGQLWVMDGINLRLLDLSSTSDPLNSSQVLVVSLTDIAYAIAFEAVNPNPWLLLPLNPSPVQQFTARGSGPAMPLTTLNTSAFSDYQLTALAVDGDGSVYLGAAYPASAFYTFFLDVSDELSYSPSSIQFLAILKYGADGSLLYAANVTSAAAGGKYFSGFAVTSSGSDLYACTFNELFRFNGTDGTQLASVVVATDGTDTPGSGSFSSTALSPVTGDVVAVSFGDVVADYSAADLTLQSEFLTNQTVLPIQPQLMTASPTTGVVYVLGGSNGIVQAFLPDGTDLGVFGAFPPAVVQQLATDAAGNIYVGFITNSTDKSGLVQKLSPAGVVRQTFEDPLGPIYPAYNKLLAVNQHNGQLAVGGAAPGEGCIITVFAADGTVLNRIPYPNGCYLGAFTSSGDLAFPDFSSVIILSVTTGLVVSSFNYTAGWEPFEVAVTPDDRLFVANFLSDVTEFDLQGNLLASIVPASLGVVAYTIAYSPLDQLLYVNDLGKTAILAFPAGAPAGSGSGSGVLGDPQFVGLRGQSFQVHGIDGTVYSLVSSATTAINAQCDSL